MKKGMNYTIRAVVDNNGYLQVKWVQAHYAPKRRITGDMKIASEIRTCPQGIVDKVSAIVQKGQKFKGFN